MKLNNFTLFIKSPNAPVLALATMMITFLVLYAKMYYSIIPKKYQLSSLLDISISVIVAVGLCTITLIIIVHSKNWIVPRAFAFADFVGGLLFYADDLNSKWDILYTLDGGKALFFSMMKAIVIYFCAEIFIKEVQQIEKTNDTASKEIDTLQARLNELLTEAEEREALLQASEEVEIELKEAIASLNQELSATRNEKKEAIQSLTKNLELLRNDYKAFEHKAKVWGVEYYKRLIENASKAKRNGILPPEREIEIMEYEKELEVLK